MVSQVISATVGTFFFGFIFNIRGNKLFYAALGGGIASLSYEVFNLLGLSNNEALFLSAIFFATYAEVMARVLKTTVTTFAISGMIPLVPGNGMYLTMMYIVNSDLSAAVSSALTTLSSAGILALGIMIVSTVAKGINEQKLRRQK